MYSFFRVFLFLLIFDLSGLHCAWAQGAWGVTTLDSAGDTGYNPSLAIDSQGRSHIAYNDWANGDLRYAYFDGNSWRLETIVSAGLTGGTPSLALDSSENPHISFFDFDKEQLWYAKKNPGGGWTTELVDASTRTGIYSSIKIATDGRIHIAYEDLSNLDLKYATRPSSGSWTIETVDSQGDVGQFASLALDKDGKPHIAYLDWGASTFDLKYAVKKTTWAVETAASANWVGFYASLVVSSDGVVHIAHQDATNHDLIYTKKTSSGWYSVAVDTAGDVGEYASLALDKNGNPHMAYYDSTNRRLKHAEWTGTAWSTATLADTGPESWNTSIAIDPYNNPHIAYLNWLSGDLKYARWSNAPVLAWTGETNYKTDGLDPETGNPYTKFTFKVAYSDQDNDPALAGTPQLYVNLSSNAVSGSPFAMTGYATSGSTTLYKYEAWLPAGKDYNYRFDAKDRWGVPAMGEPLLAKNGPIVDGFALPQGEDQVFAYPNPAKGDKITFRLTLTQLQPAIEIKIFDITGAPVLNIHNDQISKNSPPVYEYTWNLRGENSGELASGIYVYYVKARDQATGKEMKAIKKLAILK